MWGPEGGGERERGTGLMYVEGRRRDSELERGRRSRHEKGKLRSEIWWIKKK